MTKTRNKTKQKNKSKMLKQLKFEVIVLGVSSLFFLFLSSVVIISSWGNFYLWFQSQQGIKTHADIIDVSSSNVSGGRSGSTFSFNITYEYTVDGKRYTAKTYSVNDKTWEQLKYLKRLLKNKEQVECYVAKSNRNLALIDISLSYQTMLWWIISPLVFGLVTLVLIYRLSETKKYKF